jgi:hypothetical protein
MRNVRSAKNKTRYQHIPSRYQIRASARHEIARKWPHGINPRYREGPKAGARGINPGHTYSLP